LHNARTRKSTLTSSLKHKPAEYGGPPEHDGTKTATLPESPDAARTLLELVHSPASDDEETERSPVMMELDSSAPSLRVSLKRRRRLATDGGAQSMDEAFVSFLSFLVFGEGGSG
jgi:hypothetical protein